jgi:prepilin-type N-terminal cleavage/methylation domain-containing protein
MTRATCLRSTDLLTPLNIRIRRHGFTLIEVLVVIAIVSLLIAILLPTMAAARQSSRRLACQSNLRQIATAWQTYLDQSDGYFFQLVNANINYGGRQGQGSASFGSDPANPVPKPLNATLNLPVVTTEGATVFQCPADVGGASYKPTCFDYFGNSYSTNTMLIGQNQLPINPTDPCKSVLQKINGRLKKLSRSKVSGESKLILVGDQGWVSTWNRYDSNRTEWHNKSYTHNIAFMDTHAEFVRVRKGIHVTDDYCVVPFEDLASQMAQCQQEVPTP